MILSQYCHPAGKGRGSGRNRHKPGKEVFQLEPPVEPIAEFCQIARKMFFPDRKVCPMDRVLHVSQDRVHPPEVRVLTAFGSASRDVGIMHASGSGYPPEGSQSVRDHHRRSGEVLPGPAVDHRFAKTGHPGQPKAHGTTVRGAGDGRHERRLSGSTPSPLSAVSFSTPVASSIWTRPSKGRLSSRSFIT